MLSHEVVPEQRDGFDGVALVSHKHELRAAFSPAAGMVGYSLQHAGDELLGQRGGLTAYAERGSTFGIPLLHPWANRLSADAYQAEGRQVELDPGRSPVRRDENGLAIHGLVSGHGGWTLPGRTPGGGRAGIAARLDYGAHEDLTAGFPFPHELHVHAELEERALTVTTVVLPTSGRAVPISFGWHPYLTLPGVPRSEWLVELPAGRRALLDERGIPTGESEAFDLPPAPLGERVYDDLFVELEQPARFAIEAGGRRVELELGECYDFAQVWAPAGQDFICFEPMTAPTNALVSGQGLRSAQPGDSFTASFTIRVLAA
ncbi:MAG TPA: aldose 1-epimerase [Thermoleophilaceae bacterium]|nr:aldose 1-epimerase [Thermoleophilaceae bacterium]